MTDNRPINCRFRLQEEGKSYPRSSCVGCGKTIGTGLGLRCSHETDQPDQENKELRGLLQLLIVSWGYQSMPGETKHPMMQAAIDTATKRLAELSE